MKNEKMFKRHVEEVWNALKDSVQHQHQAKLRNTLLKIIAEEDVNFADFVDLMRVNGWDEKAAAISWFDGKKIVSKSPAKRNKINKELAEIWDATEPAPDGEKPVLHQCHYCGNMYHVSDLTGAKLGLICYKCRHEMETRE